MAEENINLPEEVERLSRKGQVAVVEGEEPINIASGIEESKGDIKEVSGLQKAGLGLAKLVLWAILAVLVVIVADWVIGGPTVPEVPTGSNQAIIENYAALRDADLERPRQLFILIISGGLLPVSTLLLGYIFGSRDASN